ncbi:MAG: GGDEF domain-containing protein [Nitrospirae bacterium]|nr:GGDEF domain-containing protein [Nitrospirota bacterium]
MDKKLTDKLVRRLIANAKKIQRARYGDLDELYDLTKAGSYPKNIVDLAESFGMMAVKLEAREYKLEQTIAELKETSDSLRVSKETLVEYNRTLERKVRERTAEIMKMASTDDLTQLFNRKELLSRLRFELSRRALRDLSLIFFDIDHFKEFNDTYGHQTGDEVLRTVADTVRKCIRESDIPGRFGGEEFVIVLPETNSGQAFTLAGRIREHLEAAPLKLGRKKLRVTASFGAVSLMENQGYLRTKLGLSGRGAIRENEKATLDQLCDLLLKCSDDAMYKAKKSSCLECGAESEKKEYFSGGVCHECNGTDIERGRNRVMIFQAGRFLSSP